ncbi:MAG: prephenate dehydrogenase/arogenate dehydrogenase family protein [Planctomycetes bacterium]|nr:prephenate dehydrogenase/arogenate dehydrogenase family protein [Planctomycetota bacterium]
MQRKSVTIVGVGLIGASLGLALRRRDAQLEVVGVGRRASRLREAEAIGAVTRWTTDLAAGVPEADLVIVSSPVGLVAEHAVESLRAAPPDAVVTDAGSVKRTIVADVRRAAGPLARRFVGGHPIAGGERNGPGAARPDLFTDRLVVLTPGATTEARAIERVESLWRSVGAATTRMSAAAHDKILAATSHMPHVVAAALAAATRADDLPFTGSGWADTTRIAAGDAELWTEILTRNGEHALKALDKFAKVLANFRSALEQNDAPRLTRLLEAGKTHRDALGS